MVGGHRIAHLLGSLTIINILVSFQWIRYPFPDRLSFGFEAAPSSASSVAAPFGDVIRDFPTNQLKFSVNVSARSPSFVKDHGHNCDQWVVTTATTPSSADPARATRPDYGPDWCTVEVIVPDNSSIETSSSSSPSDRVVVVLTVDRQKEYARRHLFLDASPHTRSARKNIGYLFAIEHGAVAIWDASDDLILDQHRSIDQLTGRHPVRFLRKSSSFPTYNAYKTLGATTSWPRGLPMSHVHDQRSSAGTLIDGDLELGDIAVLQTLTDHDPDFDAVYRMHQPRPIRFGSTVTSPIVLPPGIVSPINAHACLFRKSAFWMLLLPTTVNDRVADIWRGYIGQRLLWQIGERVAITAPIAMRLRRSPNDAADLIEEAPLYERSESLVAFLQQWTGRSATFPGRIEELAVDLYRRRYIEIDDVRLCQEWLQSLINVGYEFPELVDIDPGLVIAEPDRPPVRRRFWTSDLHGGTKQDLASLFMAHGHDVVDMGIYPNPFYPAVSDRMEKTQRPLAPVLHRLHSHSSGLRESEVVELFEYYKSDPVLARTDAFICSFPASLCEIFMPFNRTMIIVAGHRFLLGRCSTSAANRLIDHLGAMQNTYRTGGPRHFLFGLGRYDAEYLNYYTGFQVPVLSSSAAYYAQNTTFTMARDEILIGPLNRDGDLPEVDMLNSLARNTSRSWVFAGIRQLYRRFQLQNIANHRAVVLLPYAVLSYGITEIYAMGIPIFVPTIAFMVQLGYVRDRRVHDGWYCGSSWQAPSAHPDTRHPFSPEDDAPAALAYWLQFADYYQWPHIIYFESWKDLIVKLDRADFGAIHALMMEANQARKLVLDDMVDRIASTIETNRTVPQDYHDSLRRLWGVDQLLVDE